MSYVVLARKYRPQVLKDLVGQQHIAETLLNSMTSGKISHGFLFTGTRGVGKTSAARIFARALNCTKLKNAEPCGTCENCKSIANGNYIDVLEIDGASNRGVDDIRDLREQVRYASMQGKYKIYIIDEVHMLTKEAFNALLKTLEEPPEHVIFIFATTEVRKVPQTILSRVQRFDFKSISTANIVGRLKFICEKESISVEPEALQLVAMRGAGSMRDALSYLDQVYAYSGNDITSENVRRILGIPSHDLFLELFEGIKSGEKKKCFAVLDKFFSTGIEINDIAEGLGVFFRNLLYVMQKGMTPEDLNVSQEIFQKLEGSSKDISEGDVFRFSKALSDIVHELRTAHNPALTLEMGIARMANFDRVVLISDILSASARLEPSSIKKKTLNF